MVTLSLLSQNLNKMKALMMLSIWTFTHEANELNKENTKLIVYWAAVLVYTKASSTCTPLSRQLMKAVKSDHTTQIHY